MTKTVVCSKKIIEKKINPFELLKESITAKKSWISFIHWFDPKKDWLLHQLEQKKKESSLASMIENQKKNLHHPTSLPEEKQEKYNQNPTLLLDSLD